MEFRLHPYLQQWMFLNSEVEVSISETQGWQNLENFFVYSWVQLDGSGLYILHAGDGFNA